MHVKVKYGLAGDPPVVGEDVETIQVQTLDDRPGDYLSYVKNIVQIALRDRQEIAAMGLRDDQCMSIVNRVDVENGDYLAVLIENLSREFTVDNSTEDAIHYSCAVDSETLFLLTEVPKRGSVLKISGLCGDRRDIKSHP